MSINQPTLSLEHMRRLADEGRARPLLRTSAPPMLLDATWWAIPACGPANVYMPVDNPEHIAEFERWDVKLRQAEAATS